MARELVAVLENGHFLIEWNFDSSKASQLQSWDRIEVYCGENLQATGVTQSCLAQDTLQLKAVAPILQFGPEYHVRYISSASGEDAVLATSEPFVLSADQAAPAPVEKDICSISTQLAKVEDNNCEITIHWNFSEPYSSLSQSDMFCVMPCDRVGDFKSCYYEHAFGFASGKEAGYVKMRIGGFAEPNCPYQVLYLDNTNSFRLGASATFEIPTSDLPHASDVALSATVKAASQQFNMTTSMQYMMQTQIEKVQSASTNHNPLLTITPELSKFEAMLQDEQARVKRTEEEAEEEKERLGKQQANQPEAPGEVPIEDELVEMEDMFVSALETKPAFLFAGAGISMSAPSSSPSWWALMSELLSLTFDAMPAEFSAQVQKLHTTDASRSPEEVMETYYFILQDKLFSLFQLLEAGEPNANHKLIAKLANQGKLKTILTTNFDIFIERALDAEGVPYKVICTDEEYRDFYQNGDLDNIFAILKIHGTISRPDTIVAVANHYKTGKGFGGWKATVMHHFVKHYPTVFFGYSGWDFFHSNYQQFWEAAGNAGGERIFFLKYKGAKGGPLISKLVGNHVGDRLVIGEGILPDWGCSVMETFDETSAHDIMEFHSSVDVKAAQADVQEKRNIFLVDWVNQIPKPSILTLLMLEAGRLNEYMKKRTEKLKTTKGNESDPTVGDATSMGAYFMQLATDMGQGKITMEEYMEKQQLATMEITFATVMLPKKKKEELIKACVELNKNNPILSGPQSQTYQAILPSMVSSVVDTSEPGRPIKDIMNEVIEYLTNTVDPLREKSICDKKASVLHDLYLYQTMLLRVTGDERKQVEKMFDDFSDKAVMNDWSADEIAKRTAKDISAGLSRIAFGQIDVNIIVKSQVAYTLELSTSDGVSNDDILECALLIALGLFRQADYRQADVQSLEEYTKIVQMLAMDYTKDIPDSLFEQLEDSLNDSVTPVIQMLETMHANQETGNRLSPQEVLATFQMATAECINKCLMYIGDGYQNEQKRAFSGYYPRDNLPISAARFLSKRILDASKYIKDDRAEQSCLGMLATLGECARDIEQIQKAVDISLELTEGKVTELTPYPIPEALANAYQEAGDIDNALKYYILSLEGIRTFVMRNKTDAIVLNACLVQAQVDCTEALKMAFEFSPHFSDMQQFGLIGAGRGLLVQQCEAWARELGYGSLDAANDALTKKD